MNNAPTNTLGFLLHDASRLLRRRFELRGAQYGLSAAQWRLMVHVVRHEGISQARLAELLEIEPISVSRLVDRMEQGGWVRRCPDPQDRRVRLIHPTDRAMEAFTMVKALAGEVYEEALAGMSPERREALMDGLTQVVANLNELEASTACGSAAKEG
ncbi:MarR family winged helix-turn-helix transcriptional regulator [Acidimangrovimonas pyrenivorans]|uniref:MarR family winged helix-turn-helix transcriptional regulator n=1 Tax=Acidimangrovimonas pyrenivorans TaxID=2030798 RepID=A0ABV7AHZ1_9RHOB